MCSYHLALLHIECTVVDLSTHFLFFLQAFSFNKSSLKLKKAASFDKETQPHGPDAAELLARLTMLEEQVRMMGKELHKVCWKDM